CNECNECNAFRNRRRRKGIIRCMRNLMVMQRIATNLLKNLGAAEPQAAEAQGAHQEWEPLLPKAQGAHQEWEPPKAQGAHQEWHPPCRKNLKNSAVSKIRVVSFHVTQAGLVKRHSPPGRLRRRKPHSQKALRPNCGIEAKPPRFSLVKRHSQLH